MRKLINLIGLAFIAITLYAVMFEDDKGQQLIIMLFTIIFLYGYNYKAKKITNN